MTDVVDDIVVTGQRRPNESMEPFPSRPMPDPTPPIFDEIEPDLDPVDDPCADPEKRREWDADAAMARALERFLDQAEITDGQRSLYNREFGAVLCEFSDGSIDVGPVIYEGDAIGPGQPHPTVDVDIEGCPSGSTIIGMAHSHPGVGASSGIPSQPDITWITAINGRRGDEAGRIYIVARVNGVHKVWVYNNTNAAKAALEGLNGPEVNPEGQSCPALLVP